ncbi:MAG: acetylxylan esterase [candidate division WS1 bacterium]|nr:acetylxylan esterase [candidate division WS1 bacterium]
MKLRTAAVAVAIVLIATAAFAADPILEVIQDREDGIYACGDTATFAVRLLVNDAPVQGTVGYHLSLDGVGQISAGELQVGAEPVTVSGSLDAPGVLRCTAWADVNGTRYYGFGGAAYDPEQIGPSAAEPEDFDEWWAAQKALLAEVPMDAQLEERTPPAGVGALYKVSLANVDGRRVYGWLALPEGDAPAPGLMNFTAAGVSGTGYGTAAGGAANGFVAMHIIHHNFDVETPKEVTDAMKAGELAGYPHQGRESRETYYFRHVFLGCVRAIDLLTSRPEWDGEHLAVTGSSQGGGLSLVLSGLDDRVTALAANVPALCDHTGLQQGRASGWPRLIPSDDPHGVVAQVAPYFDAVNFARRFDGDAWVTVGLIDRTCPATSVYCAYNALQGPKQILVYPRMGHAAPPEYGAARMTWLKQVCGME